jgi:hypothetical protein
MSFIYPKTPSLLAEDKLSSPAEDRKTACLERVFALARHFKPENTVSSS